MYWSIIMVTCWFGLGVGDRAGLEIGDGDIAGIDAAVGST